MLSSYNNIEGVDDAWDVTKEGQDKIQPEGARAADFQKHTQRRKEDGHDDLQNVAANHDKIDVLHQLEKCGGRLVILYLWDLQQSWPTVQPHERKSPTGRKMQ